MSDAARLNEAQLWIMRVVRKRGPFNPPAQSKRFGTCCHLDDQGLLESTPIGFVLTADGSEALDAHQRRIHNGHLTKHEARNARRRANRPEPKPKLKLLAVNLRELKQRNREMRAAPP